MSRKFGNERDVDIVSLGKWLHMTHVDKDGRKAPTQDSAEHETMPRLKTARMLSQSTRSLRANNSSHQQEGISETERASRSPVPAARAHLQKAEEAIAAVAAKAAAREAARKEAEAQRFTRVHLVGYRCSDGTPVERESKVVPFRWELPHHEQPQGFATSGRQSMITPTSSILSSRIVACGSNRSPRLLSPRRVMVSPRLPSTARPSQHAQHQQEFGSIGAEIGARAVGRAETARLPRPATHQRTLPALKPSPRPTYAPGSSRHRSSKPMASYGHSFGRGVMALEDRRSSSRFEARISMLFALIDADGDGTLTRTEIMRSMRTDRVVRELLGLGEPSQAKDTEELAAWRKLFEKLDSKGEQGLTPSEFASAIMPFLLRYEALARKASAPVPAGQPR